jgi:hypothetical protein
MKICTEDLVKENTNKDYQEKDEKLNMEEWEKIFTLLQ